MKIIISEAQHKRLFEEKQKVLHIPDFKIFGNDWDILQRFLESKGNPPYSLGGNLKLGHSQVESLGNLISVDGNLNLSYTQIKSLENLTSVAGYLNLYYTDIKTLGNLTSVGGNLNLGRTPIESFGDLVYVGGDLNLFNTPISMIYYEKDIRKMVNVGGAIIMDL
jgi:hypothetical protein